MTTQIQTSQFQFMFPFMLKEHVNGRMEKHLLQNGFEFFQLKNFEQEDKFYGGNVVSHRSLEKYFLPNIERILFPISMKEERALRRFTKVIDLSCELTSKFIQIPFKIPSFDIIICPFQIGIMNIRVDLPKGISLSDSLQFGSEFRMMEPLVDDDPHSKITNDHYVYHNVKDFIFEQLCKGIREYINEKNEISPYFGSLPYFMDERMYVIGYLNMEDDSHISSTDLFRIGHLSGYDSNKKPIVGAKNPEYIKRYYENNVYDRWADETFFVVSDYTFSCATNSKDENLHKMLANAMNGNHYYSILLYYYYKIVLMKLTHEQSTLQIDKDEDKIEGLIKDITEFSSGYYFPEVNSSTIGKEIFRMVKDVYHIDYLLDHVKTTLETLYQNHEKIVSKRDNYLLQILTIYTVISGIYGMNQVIQDWDKALKWDQILSYSFFEWIALIIGISGITIGTLLGFFALKNWLKEMMKKRR